MEESRGLRVKFEILLMALNLWYEREFPEQIDLRIAPNYNPLEESWCVVSIVLKVRYQLRNSEYPHPTVGYVKILSEEVQWSQLDQLVDRVDGRVAEMLLAEGKWWRWQWRKEGRMV